MCLVEYLSAINNSLPTIVNQVSYVHTTSVLVTVSQLRLVSREGGRGVDNFLVLSVLCTLKASNLYCSGLLYYTTLLFWQITLC